MSSVGGYSAKAKRWNQVVVFADAISAPKKETLMYPKTKLNIIAILAFALVLVGWQQVGNAETKSGKFYKLTDEVAAKISAAAPDESIAKPHKARKVLVYGRVPTHPESVTCCFHAMKEISRKSGAFEVVCSGDPAVFLPASLAEFDAVVMNNTHERYPLRPVNFDSLDKTKKNELQEREEQLKKSLLEFVKSGKGIVGIHGAVAGNVQWPEYLEMFNGSYGGHFSDTIAVVPITTDHPICRPLGGETFHVFDELYIFKEPYDPRKVDVLLALDLTKMNDPGRRPNKDYPVSWVRSYGKGRVFYCSLGHFASAYSTPEVLKLYLAGIQWAIGDLRD
jgi:type 1 glutamine amidotransferase